MIVNDFYIFNRVEQKTNIFTMYLWGKLNFVLYLHVYAIEIVSKYTLQILKYSNVQCLFKSCPVDFINFQCFHYISFNYGLFIYCMYVGTHELPRYA